MQPRFYPDAGSLPKAQALPLDTPFVSVARSVSREVPSTSPLTHSAQRTMAIRDRERAPGQVVPSIRGLCNAVPLSIMLWVAILLVCCG